MLLRCIKNVNTVTNSILINARMMSFTYTTDRFNGILIKSDEQTLGTNEFNHSLLQDNLKQWEIESKRGVWFQVNINQSEWVPILTKNGFIFHHAKDDYVMLIKWLPKDEEFNIPKYSHTMIGVGAVVINDNDEILAVKEKYFITKTWKLPGGYVEPGENFVDAAIREVYEEANIKTEFETMVAMRHGHGGSFNCSDLYLVVCLKASDTNVTKCSREIADIKWMKFDEYLNHPEVHELNRFFLQKYLSNREKGIKLECTHGIHQILKKPYILYHAK